jgi:hypothetical protein
MNKPPPGNGSGRFEIDTVEMGGWIRLYPHRLDNLPPDFGVFLSHTLSEWFRQRPHFHLRCVVPIQRDGNTVELHAWYDVHLQPPAATAPKPTSQSTSNL